VAGGVELGEERLDDRLVARVRGSDEVVVA